jgi:hypothetical protein
MREYEYKESLIYCYQAAITAANLFADSVEKAKAELMAEDYAAAHCDWLKAQAALQMVIEKTGVEIWDGFSLIYEVKGDTNEH